MNTSVSEVILGIENQYISWSSSGKKTQDIVCRIEDIDVKIICNRGYWIYPVPNCPTPAIIENTINITSSHNDKIKDVFENYLLKERNVFSFPKDSHERFEIRYFLSESHIKKTLQEEEKAYAPYKSPRWGLHYECRLI